MDLMSLIRSGNAANIQLVVNAEDLRDFADKLMAYATKTIKERDVPDYYTREQLADKLHVSLVTLNRWKKTGILPEPITIEGRVLYDKAAVRDTINSNYKTLRKLTNKNIEL